MNRRDFLTLSGKAAIAVVAAPAIVKAENIMKVWVPPEKKIVIPETTIKLDKYWLEVTDEYGKKHSYDILTYGDWHSAEIDKGLNVRSMRLNYYNKDALPESLKNSVNAGDRIEVYRSL